MNEEEGELGIVFVGIVFVEWRWGEENEGREGEA